MAGINLTEFSLDSCFSFKLMRNWFQLRCFILTYENTSSEVSRESWMEIFILSDQLTLMSLSEEMEGFFGSDVELMKAQLSDDWFRWMTTGGTEGVSERKLRNLFSFLMTDFNTDNVFISPLNLQSFDSVFVSERDDKLRCLCCPGKWTNENKKKCQH